MADKTPMPTVDDPAPPIEATTATGQRFSLAESAGKWTVLLFYPMANTPG